MPKKPRRKGIDLQWKIYRTEALAECQICRGRTYGDCSYQCRYYLATAQEVDRSTMAAEESGWSPARWRLWEGPTEPPAAAESA